MHGYRRTARARHFEVGRSQEDREVAEGVGRVYQSGWEESFGRGTRDLGSGQTRAARPVRTVTGLRLSGRREVAGRRAPFSSSFPLPLGAAAEPPGLGCSGRPSRAGGAERVRHGKFRSKNRCVTDYCNSCFCETESLIFCFLYTERVPHVPSRNFARRRGVGAAAARRPTADPAATPVKDLVAGKWRRNRLKRLNQ